MPLFVSHSQQDEAIYSTLCKALDLSGVARWDPKTMAAGDSLADQLRQAIQRCELCGFIGTRRSIESQWCLAELGAFWGAGKRVIIFLADPDLTDSVLPPQFKGMLREINADKLISALKSSLNDYHSDRYDFYATSGNYGKDTDWAKLLDETADKFSALGVALTGWRMMNNSTQLFVRKAEAGCKIRILLMSEENPLLHGLLLGNKKSLESVVHDIQESYRYYQDLSNKHQNIEVRQVKKSMPHFFLTINDHSCLLIQYTSSIDWGNGPTWYCPAKSDLYNIAEKEFSHLWDFGTEKLA